MRFFILLLAAVLPGSKAGAADSPPPATRLAGPSEEVANFTYQGKPIHPGCVWEFEVWMSEGADDPPRVLTVDVDSCTTSQKNFKPVTVGKNGYVTCRSSDDRSTAWFSYKRLGTTSTGTHVLATESGGEGTMVSTCVYLVRVETEGYFTYREGAASPTVEKRLVLKCVGQIGQGDRDNGTVELRGDTLVLGTSRYRNRPKESKLP